MPKLLEKVNTKLLLWGLGGILAVGLLVLVILLALRPAPQTDPEQTTTDPVSSLLEENPYYLVSTKS